MKLARNYLAGLLAGVLVAGLGAVPVAHGEEDAIDLDVMSFNIRFGTADDGPDSWPYRKAMVADMIIQYMPDIIGTQETLEFQADYLEKVLPEYRWFGVGRQADLMDEHTAFLYNHETVRPVKIGNFWLSETPHVPGSQSWDSALPRMVTWARFYHLDSQEMVTVYNTHFDHRGQEAREESSALIRDRVEEHAEDESVIVLGDFNAQAEEDRPWEILVEESRLDDAWLTAVETEGPEGTWSAFAPPEPDSRRIDWILVDRHFNVDLCETVLYNQDGRYPSDHYPVYARLQWRPSGD